MRSPKRRKRGAFSNRCPKPLSALRKELPFRLSMSRKAGSAVCLAMMITAHLLTRAWPHGHLLASGSFHQVMHKGSGEARIYRLSDASLLLAIRSFRTAYVPDLEVFLIANTDAP